MRPPPVPLVAALALGVITVAISVRSQSVPSGHRAPADTPDVRAEIVRRHVVSPTDSVDGLDPAVAPGLVFTSDGALLVTRDRAGALTLSTLDPVFRRVSPRRVLSDPAGAYTLAQGPPGRDGAAVLYIDHGREVVLAILGPSGEARNVPRMLARADEPVPSVALVPTDGGWAAVWATASHAVFIAWVDALGTPRTAPQGATQGNAPRVAWLPEARSTAVAVDPVEVTGDPMALVFGPDETVSARLHGWFGMSSPVETSTGVSAVAFTPTGTVSLVHLAPGTDHPAGVLGASVQCLPVTTPPDGVLAVQVTDAHGLRQSVGCLPNGAPGTATAPLTVVRTAATTPGTLAVRGDGELFSLAREGPGHAQRLVAVQVTCRR